MSFVLGLHSPPSNQRGGCHRPRPCVTLLAYVSGFWFLIALLVLSPEPVRAEWVAIDAQYQSPGLQTLCVDSASIRRDGKVVTMVTLIDWRWMQGNRSPTRFYSTKLTKQFDCAGKRLQRLAYADFYGHMGTGRQISVYEAEDNWYPDEPESLNHTLWELACGEG